ncbi:MAG: exodeoxyribonuclease VII small subunit [Prevotellaceae bacterium]|jgi:exodeoxyribonuclease VII small subunit|nr:exodeoxyribonuclease VII small subunit [Prevotellaceae bacterium]
MKNQKTSKPATQEEKKLTYLEAVKDLANIIDSMENANLNMDELSEKVNAAIKRLEYCKKALHVIEQNVNGLIKTGIQYTEENNEQ